MYYDFIGRKISYLLNSITNYVYIYTRHGVIVIDNSKDYMFQGNSNSNSNNNLNVEVIVIVIVIDLK